MVLIYSTGCRDGIEVMLLGKSSVGHQWLSTRSGNRVMQAVSTKSNHFFKQLSQKSPNIFMIADKPLLLRVGRFGDLYSSEIIRLEAKTACSCHNLSLRCFRPPIIVGWQVDVVTDFKANQCIFADSVKKKCACVYENAARLNSECPILGWPGNLGHSSFTPSVIQASASSSWRPLAPGSYARPGHPSSFYHQHYQTWSVVTLAL